jgi:hypothetical protein
MKKLMDFLKKQPLLTGAIGVAFVAWSIRYLGPRMEGDLEGGMFRMGFALAACVFLYLISGEKAFERCGKTTGYVLKVLLPLLIYPALAGILGIIDCIHEGTPVAKDWPVKLIIVGFSYLAVGLVEEITARGLINDSLLYQFRDSKHIFPIIAIVGGLVFGGIHLLGTNISDPMSVLQGIMKTLSSGAGGLCWLFMYWKTRNLWGLAINHALFDFLASVPEIFFVIQKSSENTYVQSGSAGIGMIVVLGVDLLLTVVIAVWIWKKHMKDVDFEEIRKTF